MRTKGIDVSSWNGVVDWGKVKTAGVEFAILKIIRKDMNPDKQFENNWKGCTENGIPVQGVYNYSYAATAEKAAADARRVLEVLGGRKAMVWLDIEDNLQKNIGGRIADIINAYKNVIAGAGLEFGVYTGLSFYNSYMKPYTEYIDCPFWIARYPSSQNMNFEKEPDSGKQPDILHELWGWQYTSKGIVNGISGNVDLNELYVAVETGNVMPDEKETLHKVGEVVKVSSYYVSSTDGIEKAVIKDATGTINRVISGANNPYLIERSGVAIGWCNDGDIRSVVNSTDKENNHGTGVHKVKSGDTLSAISKKYGTTVNKIVSDNKEKYPRISKNFIMVGWNLDV